MKSNKFFNSVNDIRRFIDMEKEDKTKTAFFMVY